LNEKEALVLTADARNPDSARHCLAQLGAAGCTAALLRSQAGVMSAERMQPTMKDNRK